MARKTRSNSIEEGREEKAMSVSKTVSGWAGCEAASSVDREGGASVSVSVSVSSSISSASPSPMEDVPTVGSVEDVPCGRSIVAAHSGYF